MGMKIVSGSIAETDILIRQTGEKTVKNISRLLVQSAELIAETAKTMAPVEHMDLRESIGATPVRGANGRTEVTVDIDPNAVDENGVPTRYYGAILHEALSPYGSGGYNLGKLSAQLAASGAPIGGKFMKRALEEHKKAIYAKAQAIAKNVGIKK